MSSITTPLSAPPRPSSSRSVAPSISGSTLCDYPITTGGNVSAFGSRNGNWPALLLGDLQFTAAETNLVVDAHHNSASANAGATSSSNNTHIERGYGDRDRADRLNDYFRPLTSTNTNTRINGSDTSSSNSGSYSSNPGISVTTRTRSHTSSRSASTGRSSTSTNQPYIVGGSSSSSNNQASSSATGNNQSQYNSNPRGLSPNGIGIGRYGPGTAAHNNVGSSTIITTCTSSSSSTSSSTHKGHKRHPSMVTLEQIQTSNAHIMSSLPSGLVAVFVGATRGIGEATLKQFVRYAVAPRVYFVGRDRTDGERVGAELANINPEETKESLYYPSAVTFYARIRFIVNLLPELQKSSSLRRVVSVYNGTKEGAIHTGDFQCRHLGLFDTRAHSSAMMTLAFESLALEAPDVSFVHTFPGLVRTKLGQDSNSAGITVLRGVFKVLGPLVTIPVAEAGERQLFMATSAMFPARGGRDVEETAGVSLGFGLGDNNDNNNHHRHHHHHHFFGNHTHINGSNNHHHHHFFGNHTHINGSNSRPSIEIRNTDSGTVLSAVSGNNNSNHSARNSHSSHSTTHSSSMSMSLKVARGTDGREGSGVYSVSNDGEGLSTKTEEVLRVMREQQDMVRKVWLHVEDEFVRITGSAFVA
ncbi:hypothetical protein QBC32DRAFT_371856 [Pseudoneurospora amorphoporcata]|uniref:Uncharacterized protein n=1 Tax=Pseudoneurospora amorphoporcata TaxID=241081 RepID=A0AAN6NT51_9PEZI|nr:hypothetical protein QBC32DRAFT_371856 [Pseudoneurospora amorphoporcata]